MPLSNKNKSFYFKIGLLLCGLVVALFVYKMKLNKTHSLYVSKSPVAIKLTAEEKAQIKKMIDADLSLAAEATETEKIQKTYINLLLRSNPTAQDLFMQTYKFFGAKPEAFPAARFAAMYTQINGGAGFKEAMAWTLKDVEVHSQAIMDRLQENQEQIAQYPAYQIASLNLVHQLAVSRESKAQFYASSISQKLEFDDNGGLKDQSQGFELALMLAKQDQVTADQLRASIHELAIQNSGDSKKISLIRVRVENYYPELVTLIK